MVSATLTCHPASVPSGSSAPIRTFSAQLDRPAADRLTLRFQIHGAIDQLLIPAATQSSRIDGLWKHTCMEAFFRVRGAAAYYEFNFSPSGEWAAYRFDAYRSGMTTAQIVPAPEIATASATDRLEITVALSLPAELVTHQQVQASLTAVIEERPARISYWAVTHATANPDFHHDDSFVLSLPSR